MPKPCPGCGCDRRRTDDRARCRSRRECPSLDQRLRARRRSGRQRSAPRLGGLPRRRGKPLEDVNRHTIDDAEEPCASSSRTRDAARSSGQDHLVRLGTDDGKRGHRLHRALHVRLPGDAAASARRAARASADRIGPAGHRRRAAAEQHALGDARRRETRPRHRARRRRACRAARTIRRAPSTMRPPSTAMAARECAAELEEDERDVAVSRADRLDDSACSWIAERNRAHLVRGAHVDAVHLAVCRYRRQSG